MSIESISLLNSFTPFPDSPETASGAARREQGTSLLPEIPELTEREQDSALFSEESLLLARKQEEEAPPPPRLAAPEDQAAQEPPPRVAEDVEDGEEPASTVAEEEEGEVDEAGLTEEEREQIEDLQDRDLEVRTHEQAHLRAAGDLAIGGASFEYQRGPDGKNYAIGGHVDINVSEVPNDPEATIIRAEQVRRAALAPAEPSGKDRQVAAQAQQLAARARAEIREESFAETEESSPLSQDGDEENTSAITDDAAAEPAVDFTGGFDAEPPESSFFNGNRVSTGYDFAGSGTNEQISGGLSLIA
jgi:hypothetical protein